MRLNIPGYALLMLWTSCNTTDPRSNSNLDFEMRKLEKQACQEESCAGVLLNYPYALGERESAEKLNDHIEQQLVMYLDDEQASTEVTSLDSGVSLFFSSFLDYAKVSEITEQWQVTVNARETYQDTDLVSILFDNYSYKGGAHPNSFQMFLNFDKKNRRLIKNEELILDKPKLMERIEKEFREIHQVEDKASLKEDERFFLEEEEGLFLPVAVGYDENDFVLIYNPYEIGPYALRATEIRIPLDDLENIVYGVR